MRALINKECVALPLPCPVTQGARTDEWLCSAAVRDRVGFRKVIEMLSKARVPVVGHNCLL